ncbi:SAP domain-containing protein [Streptomyces sp. LZ34]
MTYESIPIRDLQAECKRRGLPSGRAKAELVQRLTDDDANQASTPEPDLQVEQEPETVVTEVNEQPLADTGRKPEPQPTPMPVVAEPREGVVAPTVFRQAFPASPEGPSEDQHDTHRRDTRQAAVDAGHTPRGDARRIATVDGHDVYEISIRAAT